MKNFIYLALCAPVIFILSCSAEKNAMRKAANAVDRSDFEKAITHYESLLKKDSNNYYGNAGKGIVLSEYLERHEQAIPYLERALQNSPKKTMNKLNSDLGKGHHFVGNYSRALHYYNEANKGIDRDDPDYDVFLAKRIADCKYAMSHPETAAPDEQSVSNLGQAINTDMPEYGPIFSNNRLLFTSKRQDDKKEKKNGVDGKYFESAYTSDYSENTYSSPKRIPLIEEKWYRRKRNESVVSLSPDGSKYYIFKDGLIYEGNPDDSDKELIKMDKTINMAPFQNHAFVTADQKTIFFTSETGPEGSGTDIYRSQKNEDGKWSTPELLSFNTSYSEDSPYLAENGTLYFASNGLPGYGGFDIYKTKYENGAWTTPVNLGQPINSPGDELHFVLKPNSSYGYYASSRKGGYGDMDIYQVHYIAPETPGCNTAMPLVLNTTADSANPFSYKLEMQIPEAYKNRVKYTTWKINDKEIKSNETNLQYTFNEPNNYVVAGKAVIYCDTCPTLVVLCEERQLAVERPEQLVSNEPNTGKNSAAPGKGLSSTKSTRPEASSPKTKNMAAEKGAVAKDQSAPALAYLSDEQLKELGWNNTPAYFETNKYDLNQEARSLLDQNSTLLQNNSSLFVIIDGYADSRGSAAHNMSLSQKRANSIKNYFVKKGISSSRISAVGHGENGLTNSCVDNSECSDDEHRANRRVQFKLTNSPVKPGSGITKN